AAEEIAKIELLCAEHNATEVFYTSDPEEAEAIIVARRMAIPAIEQKGTLLLEDVGVPLPSLGELVRGIEQISTNEDVMIAVIAHAGCGHPHPLLIFDLKVDDQKR